MLTFFSKYFRNFKAAARLYVGEHHSYNVFQRLAVRTVATRQVLPGQNRKQRDYIKQL